VNDTTGDGEITATSSTVSVEIIDITVNGQPAQRDGNTFHAIALCGSSQAGIEVIPADRAARVEINGIAQNPATVDLPDYGNNVFTITVTAPDNTSETYTLVIVRYYDHVEYEYPDVPTVNCNTQDNGGYVFTDFQWFRDGVALDNAIKPYYQIRDNAVYYCEIILYDGRKWRTCDIQLSIRTTGSLKAYPNPTPGLITISNEPAMDKIQVFDLYGRLVLQPYTNPFDMSALPEGVYVIKVNDKTVRVVVKK
jgi:hypothetical protein